MSRNIKIGNKVYGLAKNKNEYKYNHATDNSIFLENVDRYCK